MRYRTALAVLVTGLTFAPETAMAHKATSRCGSIVRDDANDITATSNHKTLTLINDHARKHGESRCELARGMAKLAAEQWDDNTFLYVANKKNNGLDEGSWYPWYDDGVVGAWDGNVEDLDQGGGNDLAIRTQPRQKYSAGIIGDRLIVKFWTEDE